MVLLDKFFRSNVLSWIEAVAATGTLSPLILTARNLRDFLEFREKHRRPIGNQFQLLAEWSTDLERIAAKFGTTDWHVRLMAASKLVQQPAVINTSQWGCQVALFIYIFEIPVKKRGF